MSYKTKLQTNNDNLEGNNIDLQSILNTINELPAAGGGTEDLDAEITEQEGLIEQIEAALVGKAAGGVVLPEYELSTRTINYETTDTETICFKYLTPNENGVVVWEQTERLTGIGSIDITALLNSWINIYCESDGYIGFSRKYKLSITETPDDSLDTYYCVTYNDLYDNVAEGALFYCNDNTYQFNVSWVKEV